MKELERILIHASKIFNCVLPLKKLLLMCLVTVEKKPWIYSWSRNFQTNTFEKITITVTEVCLIQVSFDTVCSKQKSKKKTHGILGNLHSIQKSGVHKIWKFLFSLASVMEFSNIYLWVSAKPVDTGRKLNLRKTFRRHPASSDNSKLTKLVDFQHLHEKQ